MSDKMATETIYGTIQEQESHVMSERVQSLAATVYKEFEKVIKKYDEDVVKDLMPLVVGILESLDAAFTEKQELDVEIELLREDNEQLLTQYEREKQLRKSADQKYLELEDNADGVKKELEDKVETLESLVRMSEIKSKNAADHVSRLEEKENEAKGEYTKLHERYTELFRTHMDYMERTKILMGTDKLSELTSNSPRVNKGFHLPGLRPVSVAYGGMMEFGNRYDNSRDSTPLGFDNTSTPQGNNLNLKNELGNVEPVDQVDNTDVTEKTIGTTTTPELEDSHDSLASQESQGKRKSVRNDNSIFEELSIQGTDMIAEVDFGADITGQQVNPGDYASAVGDNFFGMGKELENLIMENTELLATKNALNIVKDDLIAKVDELSSEQEILREEITSLQAVRGRLQLRISQLEEELKKMKEENDKKKEENHEKGEDENDVPMAQRKRFTRVEMARVLMERNQYKERLMELQEAVRWTEMIRASREHPGELQPKKKSSVWNFFSNLFSSSNKPKRPLPAATVKYNAPTTHVQPVGDPNKKSRDKGTSSSNPKSKAYDFLQEDLTSEKAKRERERERREQYKQVRAHVKKEDGRMQAYGWSLPAKFSTQVARADTAGKANIPVPVPVYCRPLFDNQMGWKIWCAAGVNLTGGRTRDGGSIVGASVFYSDPPEESSTSAKNDVEKLNKEIKDHEKCVKEDEKDQLSSLVWVCTSTLEASRVSIIDANNPADVLETFRVSVSHILCVASIPGATESDYPVAEEILNAEVPDLPKETVVSSGNTQTNVEGSTGVGGVTFVQCATGGSSPISASPIGSLTETKSGDDVEGAISVAAEIEETDRQSCGEKNADEDGDPLGAAAEEEISSAQVYRAKGSPASSTPGTPTHTTRLPPYSSSNPELVQDGRTSPGSENFLVTEETDKLSSVLPTMWMGSQSGSLYVHSSVSNWKKCLHSVKLRDSILGIVHVKGRVLASLADGTVAIFHRAADGQWDLLNYHLLDLGKPKQSIRCMTVVAAKDVWCGYKNKIHVVNPQSMKVEKSFDAHPRKESCVRQLCWVGDGVWVSIRLDSTLRLYHAYTHQHLQDVDIEPYISKMLGTGKLGFSFVRITAMLISCNRLWIGTGNGVIISVPLSEHNKQPMITTSVSLGGGGGGISGGGGRPGGVIRVYSDNKTDSVTPGSFIPYCSMAQAQLSFHGHKDAVKFFVSVPGLERKGLSAASDPPTATASPSTTGEATPAPKSNTRLVLSGGEGYVDFRMGDGDEEDPTAAIPREMCNDDDDENDPSKSGLGNKVDRSHVIVWQVAANQS